MENLNTEYEYNQEIIGLANYLVTESMDQADNVRDQAEELVNDHLLHENIDSHQWIIYNAYNLEVIKYSDNEGYMEDNFGTEYAGQILADQGLTGLHAAIAYWCMYADVQDKLDQEFNDFEDDLNES